MHDDHSTHSDHSQNNEHNRHTTAAGPFAAWLDHDPEQVRAALARRFPGVPSWHGEWTGSWWAMVGDRLLEAACPTTLADMIHTALAATRPPPRPSGALSTPAPATPRPPAPALVPFRSPSRALSPEPSPVPLSSPVPPRAATPLRSTAPPRPAVPAPPSDLRPRLEPGPTTRPRPHPASRPAPHPSPHRRPSSRPTTGAPRRHAAPRPAGFLTRLRALLHLPAPAR
ncbi:hypothetical protein [Actinomadura algeriensis]|uniref:Uncharacterized protein n=1 Tax=Actinomadura algeriensis TaxID=1679523 RepID=A0ABR9JPV6_9ACTN|nr:hypothetical protein [Actinomadura algeriensis]MBE1532609.1 hypothetical protein [Actinomadura algeriensis]